MASHYDVCIIGAGPIGLAAGIEASRRGLTHVILEKGCLVNSIFHYPANMTFFSTSERLEIGDVPFISHGPKPTRREALEYYRRVAQFWRLNVRTYEPVLSLTGQKGDFRVGTRLQAYTARYLIMATGFYDNPNFMDIPGEHLPKVKHYYDEPHPYAFRKVAIVGGGNSAVDAALETHRVGAEVTMIVRESALKEGIKYWVKPDIENRIKEGSIAAHFHAQIIRIEEKKIIVQVPTGKIELANDFVLAMTGYHPDFEFLQKAGVEIAPDDGRKPKFNKETFESNVPGLYLAGVVCGGMDTASYLIENSREHPVRIFDHLSQTT